jgi:hypothetical protein
LLLKPFYPHYWLITPAAREFYATPHSVKTTPTRLHCLDAP